MKLLSPFALSLAAAAVLFLAHTPGVLAEEEGVIEGRLINGTAEAAPPGGAVVMLYTVREMEMLGHQSQVVDDEAEFRFEGLDTDPSLVYLLVPEHRGIGYPHPQLIRLDGQPVQQVEATVYETTTDPAGIVFERANMLLASVEEEAVGVMEMGSVSNVGDRTYIGDESGVLRLRLPAEAVDVQPQAGLAEAEAQPTEDGLVTHRPVPPGQYQVALSYTIPLTGSVLDLSKHFDYPVRSFTLYLPQMGLSASSPQLQLQGGAPVELGGQIFQVLHGQDLAAGAELSVRVAGFPSAWEPTYEQIAGGALGVTLVLGAAGWLVLRLWARRSKAGEVSTEDDGHSSNPLKLERAHLVMELADLDEQFAAGDLPEEQYRPQRDERKERLVSVTRQLKVEAER